METDEHMIFTDGSSLGNPGPGGWGAVVVLRQASVIELGGAKKHTTNNEMEMTALIEALDAIRGEYGNITIFADSQYVINGATKWASGWEKRGWMTLAKEPVANMELWKQLLELLEERKTFGMITWKHVRGHVGISGNERADEIATSYAKDGEHGLYEGPLADYAIDILNIHIDEEKHDARVERKSRSNAKAYSYLSMVGGEIEVHQTWAECERRVTGRSGVRFKKALSKEEESEIIREWKKHS